MSNYNSTLQSNNTDLQAILNTINELPEAGSGGSGGGITVETATVYLPGLTGYAATILTNDTITSVNGVSDEVSNVIIGSVFFCPSSSNDITITGGSLLYGSDTYFCFSVDSSEVSIDLDATPSDPFG